MVFSKNSFLDISEDRNLIEINGFSDSNGIECCSIACLNQDLFGQILQFRRPMCPNNSYHMRGIIITNSVK
jgi:hypothetical protein